MPCFDKPSSRREQVPIKDLFELHNFTAGTAFRPENKAQLVHAVAASAKGSRSLRALGSVWALSEAALADNVVVTELLNRHVSRPFPPGGAGLPPHRLRDGGGDFLGRALAGKLAGKLRSAGRHFVHVEAGVTIRALLQDLKASGLALRTMGSAGGQSLAGALSTGTHGADVDVLPFVEWIRAVHLVGAGGQEWWITSEQSPFANEELLKLEGWCEEARVVANDDAFNAVRVAVGRMGVVYSMIFEVEPAYSLIEVNFEDTWQDVSAGLQAGMQGLRVGKRAGIFDAPLSGLEDGWFRSEMLSRTKTTGHHDDLEYVPGPRRRATPPPAPAVKERYRKMLGSAPLAALAGLADELRGRPPSVLFSINIALNLIRPTQCWVSRRWRTSSDQLVRDTRVKQKKEGERDALLDAVTKNPRAPRQIVPALRDRLRPHLLNRILGPVFKPKKLARLNWFMDHEIPNIAEKSATSGEALVLILHRLMIDDVIGEDSRADIISAVSEVIASAGFDHLVRAGLMSDVADTHNYDLDGAESRNAAEFFFDAASPVYLDFIEHVIRLAQSGPPIMGIVGIRFMPRATALLAMQRYPRTVSVEVGTGRSRLVEIYKDFWDGVHKAASDRGAIAHWGLQLRQSAPEIEARYGNDLVMWRRMLGELSIDQPSTFSTHFSRERGLEPTAATGVFDEDAVEEFLTAFEAAAG